MKRYRLETGQIFELQECILCGVAFFIPETMGNQLRRQRNSFYCPSGHAMSYSKSEADILKDKLAAKDVELANARAYILSLQNEQAKPKKEH